jgi:hypothetical protein
VLSPQDYIDKITDGLSEEDKTNLWRFASARSSKTEAQRSGNGDESIRSGQDMGTALQALSPQARELASRAADAYQRLWAD